VLFRRRRRKLLEGTFTEETPVLLKNLDFQLLEEPVGDVWERVC
jgi:hypothetical protein